MIRRVRLAGWLDALAAVIVTMILWPMPVLRATLPWSIHGPLIAAAILLADTALRSVAVLVWGRTPFMYLLDLELTAAKPGPGRVVLWAAGWTVALVPSLLGARALVDPTSGLPARFSGLVTGSTR